MGGAMNLAHIRFIIFGRVNLYLEQPYSSSILLADCIDYCLSRVELDKGVTMVTIVSDSMGQ